jgi:hypothetical protein
VLAGVRAAASALGGPATIYEMSGVLKSAEIARPGRPDQIAVLSFSMRRDQAVQLRAAALDRGVSLSALVREALVAQGIVPAPNNDESGPAESRSRETTEGVK